jgi:hypothetical protein
VSIGAGLLNVGNDFKQLGDGSERGGRATQIGLAVERILEHDVDLFRESSIWNLGLDLVESTIAKSSLD